MLNTTEPSTITFIIDVREYPLKRPNEW